MHIISSIMGILVGLEHLFIMYIETINTTSAITSKVFSVSKEKLADEHVSLLLKNQGIYNGLLSVMIFVAVFTASKFWLGILLTYVVGCSLAGGYYSSPRIILTQGGLAIFGLLSLLIF